MALIPTFGTGLFIGAGQALAAGGPASLLGSYVLISVLTYCLTTAIAEIAAHRPALNGTMVAHSYEYGSNHLGFSLGYLRWYSLAMMVPFEITTGMVNLGLWSPEPRMAVRISMVAVLILVFNMLPQRAFRRTEAVFTGLKFVTTAGLVVFSLYLAIRGLPGTPIRGFRYWHEPGPLNEYLVRGNPGRFLGFLQSLLCSVISFTLTPEITVQRAERSNTERGPSILSMARVDSIHFFVLYLLSVFMMTFVSPFDEPQLTNHGMGAGMSPFVVGLIRANIPALRIVFTVLIFLSSVASGRSFLYISSRTLYTLADYGHAPAMFTKRNRYDVPYVAIITSALFSAFAFLSLAESSSALFNSLMYFITTSGSISWLCSCIIYLRFRRKTDEQGILRVHQSRIQPYGVYLGILGCTLLPIANALILAFPAPSREETPVESWSELRLGNAIPVYLGITAFSSLYFGHQLRAIILQRTSKSERDSVEANAATHHSWWRILWSERNGLSPAASRNARTPNTLEP
ncbi:putative proline permease [Aspergillus ibericus CBS 121593]|uniref:PHD finger and SET domain protein n=1 Tax=Aspergillus ibericus CBS 121593 TaxID=1448316 RepID=A0A395GUW4_9EURO|nr:PHD finger and SET domain protein [Aspergillus ibericus CBS 121593]RAK99182.1 PHD finger and SET domain protein [Aspergillus ibericus CBS 121593]